MITRIVCRSARRIVYRVEQYRDAHHYCFEDMRAGDPPKNDPIGTRSCVHKLYTPIQYTIDTTTTVFQRARVLEVVWLFLDFYPLISRFVVSRFLRVQQESNRVDRCPRVVDTGYYHLLKKASVGRDALGWLK